MKTKRVAVIGGGISGVSSARMLKQEGVDSVIYESNAKVGGLIECDKVDNVLFHKTGGHVFNSKNKSVLEWFWSFFDKESEFIHSERNAQILLNSQLIGYPIENNIYKLERSLASKIIQDLLSNKREINPSNFKDFLLSNFGSTLYQLYFKPYNEKIWGSDLSDIPLEWLEGKLPFTTPQEIIENNIFRLEEKDMVHSTFSYPKQNGSQFIIDRLAEGLEIKLNSKVIGVFKNDNMYQIGDEIYSHIIYTGDIREVQDFLPWLALPDDLATRVRSLQSHGTTTVLCEVDENDMSWLYLPEFSTDFHRIIFTGNFSKNNNGDKQRLTCTLESTKRLDETELLSQIKELPYNIKVLSIHRRESSYIIHDAETSNTVQEVKEILLQNNIHLVGRFAEWQYYNMDKAIEAAMDAVAKIIKINEE